MAEKIKKKVKTTGILDSISPLAIGFEGKKFMFGNQYASIILVIDYPQKAGVAWLSRIANLPGVVCNIHVKPTDPYDLIQDINKSMGELSGRLEMGGNALLMQRTEEQYKSAKTLMKKIDQEQQNVFNFTSVLMVLGKDKDDLERKERKVKSTLAAAGLRGREPLFKQKEGFMASGPWAILPERISSMGDRNMPSETIAASFPFTDSGINDGSGIILGHDKKGGIVLLDIWKREGGRTNSNMTVLGKPGMGKSTVIKKTLLNEYAQGSKIIAIDPEREYKNMCKELNGNWVDCGGGLKGRINPLQVRYVPLDDEDEKEESRLYNKEMQTRGPLSLHIQTLRTFFKLYLKGLSEIEMAMLEEQLEILYNKFEITWSTDPRNVYNDKFPHIGDLYDLINKKQREDIAYKHLAVMLRRAAIGADASLWAGPTTIENSSDFTVLDILSLQESDDVIKRAQYFNILGWAWNEISRDRTSRVILPVDECYLLIDPETPQALQFLRNVSKRIRKYGGSLMPISQNVVDFLDPAVRRHGQALIDNPTYKILMGQGEKDLEALSKLMHLSEAEIEMLSQGSRGEALLVAGNKRVHANVEIRGFEMDMFGTAGGR
ncbi:MAG: hypothetical protein LKF87_12355 [Clostridium tyrobutyricum]|uniref:VirB4 family type IV secretion system protein n=1 Tax=Clostridium tyrobutyricum TaxID=1519 RepID=UPI00242D2402|nr:hypothetical protein [Clostridium tyrobutyricum]MCH4200150.1 hypothetical protein [Clostridium tyrobutyricum]MCH4237916.1 hypothetical protein [Clostridium tyrobutyricum]MCH4259718.1 hypothetical protein [Clostridium tyrobutyricum]